MSNNSNRIGIVCHSFHKDGGLTLNHYFFLCVYVNYYAYCVYVNYYAYVPQHIFKHIIHIFNNNMEIMFVCILRIDLVIGFGLLLGL